MDAKELKEKIDAIATDISVVLEVVKEKGVEATNGKEEDRV